LLKRHRETKKKTQGNQEKDTGGKKRHRVTKKIILYIVNRGLGGPSVGLTALGRI
jgi:hypothetical protein